MFFHYHPLKKAFKTSPHPNFPSSLNYNALDILYICLWYCVYICTLYIEGVNFYHPLPSLATNFHSLEDDITCIQRMYKVSCLSKELVGILKTHL